MAEIKEWAVILGGSSGIGLASAKKLASEGYNLCIVYRERRQEAESTEKEFRKLRSFGIQCITYNKDATKQASRTAIIAELASHMQRGRVKLVLHSIAKGNLKLMVPYKDLSPESDFFYEGQEHLRTEFGDEKIFLKQDDLELTIEAMAISYYTWVKDIYDGGFFARDALCLALTSEGNKKTWRNYAAISAAKSALESISRSIALEFAPYGIRSNLIQAGVTETVSLNMIKGSEFIKEQARFRNPFGRLTRPEDVADVVYLLCQNEARWINGAIIPVDGGESIA